jgi:DNA-binding NarL/FixJ family response regulator
MTGAAGKIVGREAELLRLRAVAGAHVAGTGSLVAIDGEPGIGKSTLLDELAALVSTATVVHLRCSETNRLRPFGALLDVLGCRLGHPDASYRRVAEALIEQTASVRDTFRFDAEATWRIPAQEAITDLLVAHLDRAPTALIVDDVQWADAGTLGILQSMARHVLSSPLLVAWAKRSTVSSPATELLESRFPERLVRLQVGPLAPGAVRALATGVLGRSPPRGKEAELTKAAGNPFFVSALLADWTTPAAGRDESDAGRDGGATRERAVSRWLDRLPAETHSRVSIAALLGSEFDLAVLAEVTGDEPVEVVGRLEPAVRSGVVEALPLGRYRFSHDLLRTAFVDGFPPVLATAVHRDLARVLDERGVDEGVVATHLVLGARAGDERAAERIRRACTELVRRDAAAAAELLACATDLCSPGSPTWAEATVDHMVALQWSGHATEALDLADVASTVPMHPAHRARLRMVQATSRGLLNDLHGAASGYQAIGDDPDTPEPLRALVFAELATIHAWGADRLAARHTADRALALALEANALQAELQARCAMATIALFDGQVHEAIDHGRAAVTRGRDFVSLSPAREVYLALSLANADEHDEASIWFRKGQSDAEKVGDLWLVSRYQLARMSNEVSTGEWDSVIADAEAVLALHEDTGIGSGMPQAPAAAALVAIRRGAPDDTVDRYRALAQRHTNEGAELPGLLFSAWCEALYAERIGRIDDAAATIAFAFDSVVANARLVHVWLAADLARITIAAGDLDRAETAVAAMDELASGIVRTRSATGTAALCRGLLAAARGRKGEANASLRRAAGDLRAARWRPSLLAALDALDRLRPDPEIAAERAELRAQLRLGVAERAEPTALLTPTERAVADLVAAGLSNPAIAARLEISKRTVEHHVSQLYLKLGVTTRVAIARAVA